MVNGPSDWSFVPGPKVAAWAVEISRAFLLCVRPVSPSSGVNCVVSLRTRAASTALILERGAYVRNIARAQHIVRAPPCFLQKLGVAAYSLERERERVCVRERESKSERERCQ